MATNKKKRSTVPRERPSPTPAEARSPLADFDWEGARLALERIIRENREWFKEMADR